MQFRVELSRGVFYQVEISKDGNKLSMNFRKNHYRISRHVNRFGKNIILTDNMGWSTDEIVRASLDRYVVEEASDKPRTMTWSR